MNDRTAQPRRAALQLVAATHEDVRRHVWFCDACAARADEGTTPAPFDRLCRDCGVGQLLETSEALAPIAGDAFLTFDDRLVVTSLSDAAAELLATAADTATGQPLDALLCPPEARSGSTPLSAQLAAAFVDGGGEPVALTARPAGLFGIRLSVRAGICGPPRRGLVVLTCNGAPRADSGELPPRGRRSSSGATASGPARTPGRWWSRPRPA